MSSALFIQPSEASGPRLWNRLVDTVNPHLPDFQEPRAISGPVERNFGNPIAALDRWSDPKMGVACPHHSGSRKGKFPAPRAFRR
ncbi:hypothetical protein MMEU_5333 [Mycobacterium marinum str. Europe]|nr:hypothetical protein MMEU_5333 [Mycobacterium marinum str. Europe]